MQRWATTKISTVSAFQKAQPLSDVFETLRPVLASLRVVGVYTSRYERPSSSVWTCVCLGLLHAYALAACVSCVVSDDLWATSYALARTAAAVATAHGVVKHTAEVCHLLRRLQDDLGERRHGTLKRTAVGSVAAVWAFLALAVLAKCKVFLEHDSAVTAYLDRAWCGLGGSSFPIEYLGPLACLDVLVNVFFVDGVLLNGVALYLCLAVALRHRFASLNEAVKDLALQDGPAVSAPELRRLRGLQHGLCSLVLLQDALFSPTAFAWVCFFVLGICVQVTRFFRGMAFLAFCHDMLEVCGVFLTVTVAASRLTETARGCTVFVHRLLRHETSRNAPEKQSFATQEVFREGQLFVAQLTAQPVVLTGWNFFAFSRSFVLTLAGALLSYILIILQLNPNT